MSRVEQNIIECQNGKDFDWDQYQQLCDIADYWEADE